MRQFRVGIDNYGLHPLRLDPMQTIRWAHDRGADGIHFSGLDPSHQDTLEKSYLRELAAFASENGMYLEWGGAQHIPRDTENWTRKDIFESNRQAAQQAATMGARIVRSCSGGLMRWRAESPMTETLIQEMVPPLKAQKRMLLDHNVILAIETHFEFTSFELLRLLEQCDALPGEWLGICLDTMNCLTMLEDPLCAARRLLPWVVSTHIKDGGIALTREGLTTFPVAAGRGAIDLAAIFRLLESLAADVALSVEGHGGSFFLPIFDPDFLSKFPDLTAEELAKLVRLAQQSADKSASGCVVTEREQWPAVCEERMAQDLAVIKEIAGSIK